jgi:GNAT superfamily N-acetyltransferase
MRRFKKTDAAQCSALIIKCIKLFRDIDKPTREFLIAENSAAKTGEKLVERDTAYVYLTGGKIVGVGAVNGNRITRAYVDPQFQNLGIGTKIIKELENKLKSAGFKKIEVEASTEAEDFYKKIGFKSIKKFSKKDGGNIFTLVKMEKKL